ncbi:SCO family protein [Leptospira sp. GIMC2001]|uniref:SCO family protein n=1 Tax=Leptospira sp. GIMC2001 TaxID=1513297 RepID=UPI00234BAC4C|nr:SCO family protein [Leptospira sp. GIMC2001]WCL48499.1 SCO family protein [Leptospira sp. GIMC2001]
MQASVRYIFFTFLLIGSLSQLWSYDPNHTILKDNKLPKELEGIGATDTVGTSIDLRLTFNNENGEEISLSELFTEGKPVLLSPVYYKCPTLCNYHMNGIMTVLKNLDWNAGKQYQYVAISIDPSEKPPLASEKKAAYIKEYGRDGAENGYHLLTGSTANIHTLTDQLGFRYKWDEESHQYIHASVAYILTPDGKISRILQGISFDARDLKLSFIEAGEGKIGNFIDRFALFCFQFDPSKNKYTLYAYNIMQIGALVTFLVLAAFLLLFWIKNLKENDQGVA